MGIWGSSTVRDVRETVVRWEAGDVGRLSWELPVIRLSCMRVDARECEGGGEAARGSSSSSSSRAVMRRLVLGRLTTVRGRERGFD